MRMEVRYKKTFTAEFRKPPERNVTQFGRFVFLSIEKPIKFCGRKFLTELQPSSRTSNVLL